MTVRLLTNVDRVVDTYGRVPRPLMAWLRSQGFTVLGRYLDNLTAEEIADAFAEDLGILAIRFSRGNGWHPSALLGQADSLSTVTKARAVGYEHGAAIGCDLEGCDPATTVDDATAYLDAWPVQVIPSWPAMLYVGAAQPLSGVQLYRIPGFTLYWRSCSSVPDLPCSYALLQTRPGNVLLGPPGARQLFDVNQPELDLHWPQRAVPAMFRAAA
jgi:hypothetical protein